VKLEQIGRSQESPSMIYLTNEVLSTIYVTELETKTNAPQLTKWVSSYPERDFEVVESENKSLQKERKKNGEKTLC
jgi:hypothetical protein